MKNISFLVSLLFFLFSCAKPVEIDFPRAAVSLPAWVVDPKMENGIAFVGIAKQGLGGIDAQVIKAELDARTKMATDFGAKILKLSDGSLKEYGIYDNKNIKDLFIKLSKKMFDEALLLKVRRVDTFLVANKELYVRMFLAESDFFMVVTNVEKDFEGKLVNSNSTRENINRSLDASRAMFNRFETDFRERF